MKDEWIINVLDDDQSPVQEMAMIHKAALPADLFSYWTAFHLVICSTLEWYYQENVMSHWYTLREDKISNKYY